ncbi:MAG: 30S ribosomal protein S9 [Treponema sp.]|nr:30S ribosomal protein S9 [Treponema sp.]
MATIKNIAIGTGRRKTATARVFLRDGSGKIVVNGKDIAEYFASEEQVRTVHRPLLVTSNENKFDILINVVGGGLNGQAAACLHGVSRALLQIDPDSRASLKANGYLTRDSRMVERKKYGQRGARRRFQFSKR